MFHWMVEACLFGVLFSISFFVLGFIFLLINNVRTNTKVYHMKNALFDMIHQRFTLDRYPLKGKVAIVTGSTNGLGEQTASDLYGMGATVIVASRTVSRCEASIERIKTTHPRSAGSILAMKLDTSDFNSVREFVKKFDKDFPKLHFLICNAGIHYISSPGVPLFNPSIDTISAQGYDLAFATNYMGHFLLGELLLPKLTATGVAEKVPSRLVNISSAYHLSVDGSMLRPEGSGGDVHARAPAAARTDIRTMRHRRRAYGNNKLAQICATLELDRRLKAGGNFDVEVVSVCPGWVGGTGIVHETFIGWVIQAFGFELQTGTMAPIGACLNPHLRGGEHVTNYVPFWTLTVPFKLLVQLNIRDIISDLLAGFLLFIQQNSYGFNVSRSSPESYDETLAKELFDWTAEAVKLSKK